MSNPTSEITSSRRKKSRSKSSRSGMPPCAGTGKPDSRPGATTAGLRLETILPDLLQQHQPRPVSRRPSLALEENLLPSGPKSDDRPRINWTGLPPGQNRRALILASSGLLMVGCLALLWWMPAARPVSAAPAAIDQWQAMLLENMELKAELTEQARTIESLEERISRIERKFGEVK